MTRVSSSPRGRFLAATGGVAAAAFLRTPARADDAKVIKMAYGHGQSPNNVGRLRGTIDKALAAHGYTVAVGRSVLRLRGRG